MTSVVRLPEVTVPLAAMNGLAGGDFEGAGDPGRGVGVAAVEGMMAMGPAWGAGGAEDGAVWAQSAGMAMRAAIERQREARRGCRGEIHKEEIFQEPPSGAKARSDLAGPMYGLKPVPFTGIIFSMVSKPVRRRALFMAATSSESCGSSGGRPRSGRFRGGTARPRWAGYDGAGP